ncbi:hypothetical protein GGI15_001000 [Coemansia interrupta]|uniref:PH domain-containing protein n=1 Tax=Coemansia interrupta TaxID=1126814 RepID=A0A9W8LLT0_9FUNG|nr:hypothetical protein GGI15_001000 [Coemansia interrupta]
MDIGGQALRRRTAHVRKSDIRVVDGSEGRRLAAFKPADSVGSGDAHDVCHQRLSGWLAMVASYTEYFRSMAAAELDVATVYARIGDTLKVPVREGALFAPPDDGRGVQAAAWRLKALQQQMVERHAAVGRAARQAALAEMLALHDELHVLRRSYEAAVRPLHDELKQCAERAAQRRHVLEDALRARRPEKDPFIVRLEVAALGRKHAELARRLQAQVDAQLGVLGDAEPRVARRVAAAVSAFVDAVGGAHRQLGAAAEQTLHALAPLDAEHEWPAFAERFGSALHAVAVPALGEPCGAADAHVVRQGVVAMREAGPMFRSTWQSKFCVLTAHGFFHVFRSQGDVARGAPETSVYLPLARVARRAGTLQLGAGSKFSRCRIVMQDAPDSLARWQRLMAGTCAAEPQVHSGLATPPDSSGDEAEAEAEASACSPGLRTPPRPATVRRFQFTPTRVAAQQQAQPSPLNIYMRPLDASPLRPSHDTAEGYDTYSPTFSSASASASPLPSPGQAAAADALFGRARPASLCVEPVARPPSFCPDRPASFCSDRPADYSGAGAIWHADVLHVPDPAAALAGLLDPANPYLGDFLARRSTRAARSSTASSAVQTTLWRASSEAHSYAGPPVLPHAHTPLWRASTSTRSHVSVAAPLKASPPPPQQQQRLAVGPCRPSPRTSHDPIPE